jgi:single-strand DNA-binding protein
VTKTHSETQSETQSKTQHESGVKKQSRPRKRDRQKDANDADVVANDVRLVGRLTGKPAVVELPSGDELVTFRISVPRGVRVGGSAPGSATPQRVDSVPCTAWSARVRRSVVSWEAGDLVEVSGAVRCRFYQAGGATRSRVEVEASSARIIRRSSVA